MAKVKSSAQLYLSPASYDPSDPTHALALASITAAAPAVATASAALPADLIAGGFVQIEGTGKADLDGTAWRVGTVTSAAKTFELADSDRTGATAASAGTYQVYSDANLIHACMVNITVTGQAPDSIALDDMCSNETVLGDAKPPTFTFTGFVDKDAPGFQNLVRASLESPKTTRMLLIDYGENAGYIFGPAEIGEVTITAANAAGLQFSGSGVFTEVPTYSWALGPEPVSA